MSFGTFSSKYGSEPQIPMDMGVEADLPFGDFSELDVMPNEPAVVSPEDIRIGMPAPQPNVLPSIPDLPWSLIIPAGLIAVVAAGVAWYMNGMKMPEIPI